MTNMAISVQPDGGSGGLEDREGNPPDAGFPFWLLTESEAFNNRAKMVLYANKKVPCSFLWLRPRLCS